MYELLFKTISLVNTYPKETTKMLKLLSETPTLRRIIYAAIAASAIGSTVPYIAPIIHALK